MADRLPNRQSFRLENHDYRSAGAYFLTICTKDRTPLLATVTDGLLNPTPAGDHVRRVWEDLPNHYRHVRLDAFVVMPNHVHGVLWLRSMDGVTDIDPRAGLKPAPTKRHGLPEIIRGFKTFSSRRINQARGASGTPVWQRNYHEHVIREDESLNRIRDYVRLNPANWATDPDNPAAPRHEPNTPWEP